MDELDPDQRRFMDEIKDTTSGVLLLLNEKKLENRLIFQFEPRFVSTIAQCMTTSHATRLRFQWPLWRLLTEEERMETTAHEVCHAVQERHWPNGSSDAHGIEWKSLMKCVGYPRAEAECRLNPIAHASIVRRSRGGVR